MPFVETISEEGADGPVAEIYAEMRQQFGYLPNLVRAFSLRPEVYRGWLQLNGAIKAHDLRRYELATLAAARRLRSSYCASSTARCSPSSSCRSRTSPACRKGSTRPTTR